MIKFLIPFLTSFFLAVFFSYLAIWLAKKIRWQGRLSHRHIHKKDASRMGGLVMVASFNFAIFLNRDLFMTPEIYGFCAGTLLLLVVGFWDDLREIFWKIQLFIQVAVTVIIFIMGVRIYYVTNPITGGIIQLDSGIGIVLSVVMMIAWIVLIINAVNWADGIDGLAGGISFIVFATVFILSFRPEVNQPPIAIICAILMGSILGFLVFNFHPARIIAGTSGSMFMGFALAVLAIFSGAKIATTMLVLVIPIIDFLWVIGERIRNKKSIFLPDKNHLHHKLLELGWSQRKIVLSYWGITILIAIVALNTRVTGKLIAFSTIVFFMLLILFFINRRLSYFGKLR
jgi:UDP-GlcNAc:undecaprenyl-phosphate/decaprenyl-phosphate GlcNAc-1-phosphate transferase